MSRDRCASILSELHRLRTLKKDLISGLSTLAPTLLPRISAADAALHGIYDSLVEEVLSTAIFNFSETTYLGLGAPTTPPPNINDFRLPCKETIDKITNDVILDFKAGRYNKASRITEDVSERSATAGQPQSGSFQLDAPATSRCTQADEHLKRSGTSDMSRPSKRARLDETAYIVLDTAQDTPPRPKAHSKPKRNPIAPIRRPMKTDAWYSRMTSTEDAWAQVKPAQQRELSHIGYIDETDAGMPAPKTCSYCTYLKPTAGGQLETMCCRIYKPDTVKNYTQAQGQNWRSCSNCWTSSRNCPFVTDAIYGSDDSANPPAGGVSSE